MRKLYLFPLMGIFIPLGCAGYFHSDHRSSAEALNDSLYVYGELITPEFLYEHLSVIAHDSLEGRATGMRGQKKAAAYLSDFYADLGITPAGDHNTFYQHFSLDAEQTDSLVYYTYRLDAADTLLADHSVAMPDSRAEYLRMFGGSEPLEGKIIFAGFGVNDSARGVHHLEGTDLEGKWILLFEEIPHIIEGDTLVNPAISRNDRFRVIAEEHNANGILEIGQETPGEFADLAELNAHLVSKPRNMRLQYPNRFNGPLGYPKGQMRISPELASLMLQLDEPSQIESLRRELIENIREFEAFELPYLLDYRPYEGTTSIETENVLAYMEGGDTDLKDEVVVLVAHYDHIGITPPDETGDYINNGADDNGSGTTALMSVANALSKAADDGVRPKRSILFLHVSAEENGLLGSRYYSDHPVFPIENTVAALNADMISRSTTQRERRGETDYVFIIGADIISSDLDSLIHVANRESVHMELDYTYNDLEDSNQFYRRSDHWNFGRLQVPFVFFFTGVHEDYHRPGDTVDKVDFEKLSRTSRLIYSSTLQTANNRKRPEVDNMQFIDITRSLPR